MNDLTGISNPDSSESQPNAVPFKRPPHFFCLIREVHQKAGRKLMVELLPNGSVDERWTRSCRAGNSEDCCLRKAPARRVQGRKERQGRGQSSRILSLFLRDLSVGNNVCIFYRSHSGMDHFAGVL